MITDSVRNRLKQAQNVCFFTGAGMSAESGIPTFRDFFDGVWVKFDPMEVASPWGFKANPQMVWDFYCSRAEAVRRATPNAGHRAIAELSAVVNKVTVITQNIDNLHQHAGSQDVLELHGNIFRLKPFVDEDAAFADGKNPVICHVCDCYADPDSVNPYASAEDIEGLELVSGAVPTCTGCGSMFRPDVVWFGEPLDHQILGDSMAAVDQCDALIVIGSSLEVAPASELPLRAIRRGALVLEVNPSETSLSLFATATIAGNAAEVLPELLLAVWGIRITGVQ